jgi:hypothetical protein
MKRSQLAAFSKKRKASNVERKKLRYSHLTDVPQCEAGILPVCDYWATDVHEIVSRGTRPGAQLESKLFVSVCRICHGYLTDHPRWAKNHGLVLSDWEATDENIAEARRVRTQRACEMSTRCETNHMGGNDA